MDSVTRNGQSAIDTAMNARTGDEWCVLEIGSGFDCDTGNYENEREASVTDLLFDLLLYRNDADRISVRFTPNVSGEPEWFSPVYVVIQTGDSGEWSQREYRIYRKENFSA